jgi:DnaK suppressor protein
MPTGENRKSLGPLAIAGVEPYQMKAGEEYMNDQQKVHFRKILGAWRNQLMQEVDRTVDHMKDEAANFPIPWIAPRKKKSLLSNCAPATVNAS